MKKGNHHGILKDGLRIVVRIKKTKAVCQTGKKEDRMTEFLNGSGDSSDGSGAEKLPTTRYRLRSQGDMWE